MELSPQYQKRWDIFRNHISHILRTYLPIYHEQLNMMQGDLSNIPNILLYSVIGFPLDLLWKEGLKRRFHINNEIGECVEFIEKECVWGKNIPYRETPYYIQIDMANPDIPNDLELLQELLKTIIGTKCIHSERHIIILENIDHFINKNINRHVFRVLLERFSKNVWFICTTYHYNKLESPLRSRFYCIRFPLPTEDQVNEIMHYLDDTINNKSVKKQIYKTHNIIKAITTPKNKDEHFYWVSSLTYPPLSDYILENKTVTIENIRAVVYKAFQAGVTLSEFAKDIIEICVKRGDGDNPNVIGSIIKEFATYEHMASQSKGTRILLYMEYMLHYVMTIVHNECVNTTKTTKTRKRIIEKSTPTTSTGQGRGRGSRKKETSEINK